MQSFLSTIKDVKKINKAKKMLSDKSKKNIINTNEEKYEEEKNIINNNEEDYEEEKLMCLLEVIKQIKKIENLQDDNIIYYIENKEKIIKKYSYDKKKEIVIKELFDEFEYEYIDQGKYLEKKQKKREQIEQ